MAGFRVDDRVVLGSRGLGRIVGRRRRAEGRGPVDYLVFAPDDGGMRVLVPEAGAAQSGLRRVISAREVPALLSRLEEGAPRIEGEPAAWRLARWHAGRPEDLADLLRHLWRGGSEEGLSSALDLDRARARLCAELAAATGETPSVWAAEVNVRLERGG